MKILKSDLARSYGLSIGDLNRQMISFLQSEGYDDNGNEYDTLDAWVNRTPVIDTPDPYDGGRGLGQYGRED